MLRDLKWYLQQRGRAPLQDVANHFDVEPGAMKGMLEQWVRKGRVRKLSGGAACGGCSKCGPELIEIYEWIEEADGRNP